MNWYIQNKEYARNKQKEYKSSSEFKELRRIYDKKNHEHQLELKRNWRRGSGKVKDKISKQKSDHKYYLKMKYNPVFIQKEKIRHAKYSKEHPEQLLKNQINHLKKLGLSLNMAHFKTGMALKSWSQTIRNNFVSCKICADKATHTHHLFYKQYYPKLALNLNNGIPLCKVHHDEVHGKNLITRD